MSLQEKYRKICIDLILKKPIYKRVWFWIIVGLIFIIGFIGVVNEKIQMNAPVKTVVENTETALSEKEYKALCDVIDYKTLARNPEKHKGEKFKFTGKVYSVKENKSEQAGMIVYAMKIEVTEDEYGFWDDIVCANIELPEEADRLLEDDIVTFWGECEGEYDDKSFIHTYHYPIIKIEYYTLQ